MDSNAPAMYPFLAIFSHSRASCPSFVLVASRIALQQIGHTLDEPWLCVLEAIISLYNIINPESLLKFWLRVGINTV